MDNSPPASALHSADPGRNQNLTIHLPDALDIQTLYPKPEMNYSMLPGQSPNLTAFHTGVSFQNGGGGASNFTGNGSAGLVYNYSDLMSDYETYEYPDDVGVPVGEVLPVAFVYGLTLVLGILGNALVIFSIAWYRRMRSVTNIFLTSLASADLLLVLICVPIKFAKWFSFTWDFGEFLCKGVHYLQDVSVLCSVLTLTIISIERYYAILHPMQVRHMSTVPRARRVIVAVWLASFILATPTIAGRMHKQVGGVRIGYWCVKEWSEPLYEQVYELSMLVVVLVLPLSVMTFAYVSICKELWLVTSNRAKLRAEEGMASRNGLASRTDEPISPASGKKSTKADEKTRKQVIKMLVSIIVLFSLCWGPTLIDNVLVAFGHVDRLHYGYLKPMRQAFSLMSYFNSCVNPIVYAFMSKNFRDSFRYALCLCCCRCCPRGYKHGAWLRGTRPHDQATARVWKSSFPNRCLDTGGNGGAAGARGAGGQSVYTSNQYTLHSTTYAMVLDSPARDDQNMRKSSCCTTVI